MIHLAATGLVLVVTTSLILYYMHLTSKMDADEQSVNDILDDNFEDDHERWSDFSIEEELPMTTLLKSGEESCTFQDNENLCQDLFADKTADEIMAVVVEPDDDQHDIIIESILQELVAQVVVQSCQLTLSCVSNLDQQETEPDLIIPKVTPETCHCQHVQADGYENVVSCQQPIVMIHHQVLMIQDFANALAFEVLSDIFADKEVKLLGANPEVPKVIEQHDEHEDELFLVLHPPQVEEKMDFEGDDEKMALLEKEVCHLQECVELSEANAEASHIELEKEKAKVESLQFQLKEQLSIFKTKFDQEHQTLEDIKGDLRKAQEERLKERETFQKNITSLQQGLQDKVNDLKEVEESNSILRKEAMDLVAR